MTEMRERFFCFVIRGWGWGLQVFYLKDGHSELKKFFTTFY